jgi:hypothetical protein
MSDDELARMAAETAFLRERLRELEAREIFDALRGSGNVRLAEKWSRAHGRLQASGRLTATDLDAGRAAPDEARDALEEFQRVWAEIDAWLGRERSGRDERGTT